MLNRRTVILGRLFVVFGLLLTVPFAVGFQLFRINFMQGEELRELWNEQAIDYMAIPAQRGNIYDEDGTLLATTSVAYQAAIDPKIEGLSGDEIVKICRTLSRHTGVSTAYYRQKINTAPSRSRYVVLAKDLNVDAWIELSALDIRGLILEERYERRYSFGTLGAHLLGFVNHNMEGRSGLEKEYNDLLKGEDGQQQVRRDRNGGIFAYVGAPRKQPRQGYSLYTTIDAHIQAILEEELKAGVDRTRSNYGSAIVMDPRTGAIKAMANYPTFNPNHPASSHDENRRNFAISDMIEPGSTFKLVTAIAAVEQDVVDFDERFDTPEDGRKLIHGQMMRDHDPMGALRFDDVLIRSSNIATAEIAMRLSPNTFYQYARNLGFGTPTNIDLPNEESGRLQKPYEWSQVTLPWMSIGYEVLVTPLQMLQAYAAFANDGRMMRPYVVEKVVDGEERVVRNHRPVEVRRIAKKSTLEKLYPIFKEVVSDSGTAEWAQVEGLQVAGKTGTAQKYMRGEYRSSYRASFIGFFPADNPRYVCLIVLDEPKTSIYGGYTAGPVFRQTATRIAGLDDEIQKHITSGDPQGDTWAYAPDATRIPLGNAKVLLDAQHIRFEVKGSGSWVVGQSPEAGEPLTRAETLVLRVSETKPADADTTILEGYARIPDLTGMDMRRAALTIHRRGFETELIGSGTVFRQFPEAGELMKQGQRVTVRGRARPLERMAGR
ncbi:MAG: penicillin-binding transpeptidase domain-containing protein [Balneolaceae bacterium]|nr:penicillin-binding transpeptidase domain-containing protein [Balneolaceae bacterium]